MALIDREQALSHPFANGQYDKEHADEHFIMGFEDYKEWLEDLPTVEAIPKADIQKALKEGSKDISENVLAIVRENYIPKDQYEARLKADLEAILVELQLEIEKLDGKYVIGDYGIYGENAPKYVRFWDVLHILDKYKAESEE